LGINIKKYYCKNFKLITEKIPNSLIGIWDFLCSIFKLLLEFGILNSGIS